MDLSKYKDKGKIGLENLGNTCFLNACMQVLNNTYELNGFLDSEKYKQNFKESLPDSNILTEWNDLRQVMWSGNGIVSPNKFVHNVHKIAAIKKRDIFTGWAQNDMPEFLLFFMDCMHNSISRSVNMKISGNPENKLDLMAIKCYDMLKSIYAKEYSEIMDMFYGIYVSEIISITTSEKHVIKPESFFILDLPILEPGRLATNLYECMDIYVKPEILEGDNAWFNEKTGQKEDIKKQISFWNFPKILVITLKPPVPVNIVILPFPNPLLLSI
jgi:ubiquitin carboxyl-terminal hydrolase 8